MAVFKINLAIALGLLAAVSVNALPSIPDPPCPTDNLECKCLGILKPPHIATEGPDGGILGKAIKACEVKFQVTVPAPPAGAPLVPPPLEGMSREFKDCVRDNFLTNLGVMKDGVIDVAALQAMYKETINANKKADTTDAQVQKIVDALPGCVRSSGGASALIMSDFLTCTKTVCVSALTAA